MMDAREMGGRFRALARRSCMARVLCGSASEWCVISAARPRGRAWPAKKYDFVKLSVAHDSLAVLLRARV